MIALVVQISQRVDATPAASDEYQIGHKRATGVSVLFTSGDAKAVVGRRNLPDEYQIGHAGDTFVSDLVLIGGTGVDGPQICQE